MAVRTVSARTGSVRLEGIVKRNGTTTVLHGVDLSIEPGEFFVLLAERGKTVRMVTYPGSPHFPRLYEQRRDIFKEIGDWLRKYNQ